MGPYGGIYRGVVASVDDPECRYRVAARVTGIHYEDTPIEGLRFAEMGAFFSAAGTCDLPHYEVGDNVWMMFEGGHLEQPVILGGWTKERRGLPDLPPDVRQTYATNRRRWLRIDRAGNMLLMSEVENEREIRIRSGKAELIITQRDDSITLTASGNVVVNAGQARVTAGLASVDANTVNITAVDQTTPGEGAGLLNLMSDKQINLVVKGADQGGATDGAINIGQYVDEGSVTNGLVPAARQSPQANVIAAKVQIGQPTGSAPLLPTTQVNIYAATKVVVQSASEIDLTAPTIKLNGDVTITGDLDVTGDTTLVTAEASGEITAGVDHIPLSTHTHGYDDNGSPAITDPPNP